MWFAILGPLLVRDGETFVDVPKGRQRVLLAALLLHAGKPVPAGVLTKVVWDGSPPPGAEVTLRSHVLRLRRALGPRAGARLITRSPGYLLQAGEDEVDVLRFRCLCRDGGTALREGAWATAQALFCEALGFWRGAPLADVPSGSLHRDEVQNLEELRLQAEEWRIDAALHLGGQAELMPGLQSLAARHPLRERFHGQLMLALYRCDRRAEALAAYARAREILVGELGTEPGPELRELHQRILTADPALAAAAEPTRPTEAEPQHGTPRELPSAVPGFTGRSAELQALTRLLDRSGEHAPGTVVVSAIGGTAGVGKTALAVYWAHQVAERFPDGQLYVNLRGYDPGEPVPASDALAGFLRALGVPGQDIPPEAGERAARYRSLLAGRRVLVVLDNAGSADQIRPLLPGTPACTVLVTSRDALPGLVARNGATRLDLDVLPLAEAVALLRTLIGARVDAEPDAAAELAAQCCRLPLALRVAAELATSQPAVPLAALTDELADLRTRLDLLDAGGDPGTQVRAVFSWSYRHLDANTARTFRLLGLHPSPDLDPYAAAALAAATVPQGRRALDVLARAHLIQPAGQGRYSMHDLLRGYARELATAVDAGEEQRAALTRLFDYYLYSAATAMDTLYPAGRHRRPRIPPSATTAPPLADAAAAREWLDTQRASLVAVTVHTAGHGWPAHATQLAVILYRYLDYGGHYPEAIIIQSQALRSARRTGDHAAEVSVLNYLGSAYLHQGRYRQASDYFKQALIRCREIGDQPRAARALGNLGNASFLQGGYDQALGRYEQALALYRETGDVSGEAIVLNNMSVIDRRQGRYQQASGRSHKAAALARKIGDRDTEAYALAALGGTDLQLDRYKEATTHLQQAVCIFREKGNRYGEAEVLTRLGDIDLRLGRYQGANGRLRQALALHQETGERSGEANALNGLGNVLLAAGQTNDACVQHVAALGLADQIGDKYEQARAHDGLACAYHAAGDPLQARHHWQEALTRYAAIGAPEADEIRARLAMAGDDGDKPAA
jgi:DNA-binding SARP family transcriptional activator/tetratricopeptide (TPR) repeat protein